MLECRTCRGCRAGVKPRCGVDRAGYVSVTEEPEPRALARWDVTLEHYREASRLYDEFELARVKTRTLEGLPAVAEQYRAAGRDAVGKRALAQPPASGAARLKVWHAGKVLDWARSHEEDVRLDLAQAEENLQRAQTRAREAEEAQGDALVVSG